MRFLIPNSQLTQYPESERSVSMDEEMLTSQAVQSVLILRQMYSNTFDIQILTSPREMRDFSWVKIVTMLTMCVVRFSWFFWSGPLKKRLYV